MLNLETIAKGLKKKKKSIFWCQFITDVYVFFFLIFFPEDDCTAVYKEISSEFPADNLRYVIVEIIKRQARMGRIDLAGQEEITLTTITRLDRCVDRYLEEHQPDDLR